MLFFSIVTLSANKPNFTGCECVDILENVVTLVVRSSVAQLVGVTRRGESGNRHSILVWQHEGAGGARGQDSA